MKKESSITDLNSKYKSNVGGFHNNEGRAERSQSAKPSNSNKSVLNGD